MAKIKLGATPKNFKKTITFPMLDGSKGSIEVSYRYRTRKEFGAFITAMNEASKARAAEADDALEATAAQNIDRIISHNVNYVMACLDSWNLDEPLSEETMLQLANEIPAALTAIIDSYGAAIMEGRLGN